MASRAARGGQRAAAPAAVAPRGKPQPAKPDPSEIVAGLIPVLEAYGYHEAEVLALVKRCNCNTSQIEEAVSHILEQREGHEFGEWATTATATEKKDKVAAAKERKAREEKEREEAQEREKVRRAEREKEEQKRYLEMAERKAAFEQNKKNKPGSALVQRAAPWSGGAVTEDSKEVDAAELQEQEDESQGTGAGDDEHAAVEEAPPAESWTQPEAAQHAAPEAPPPALHLPSANGLNGIGAPPGVPVPDQAAAWGAQYTGGYVDGSAEVSQAHEEPWHAPEPTNGKAQWTALPPASSPAAPSVVPMLANDTVVMPQSFWDLIGNGSIPQVMFGSLNVQSAAETADSQAEEDQEQPARREPRNQPPSDRRGGKEGGGKKGERRGKGKDSAKGEAGGDSAADDGKGGKRKGSARSGGDRGGPSSGGKGNKGGWRAEKGKGSSKAAPSQ